MGIGSRRQTIWLWLLGVAWLVLVGAGFGALAIYKSTPGAAAVAPATWPTGSALERAVDAPTLVLFAHPRCACTRASVSELARLLARLPERPRVYVALIRPRGVASDWVETDLLRSAAHLPGARVFVDDEGREAARFAAATSGTTLVYDAAGRLLFSGGLTSARGHEGDSFGQRRLLALLTGGAPDRPDSPVFGCPLDETQPKEAAP